MADGLGASQPPQQNVEMEQRQEAPPALQTSLPAANTDSTPTSTTASPPTLTAPAPAAPAETTNDADQVTVPPPAVIQEHEAKHTAAAPELFAPISITLLSSITGSKSNFTLNSEYLQHHNLDVPEPLAMTAYNLKECIWRDWKEEEMDKRPTGAHLIRLIFFGRLLEDRSPLKDYRFQTDSANVIHLSLKPSESGNDDDATTKTGKGFGLGMGRRSGTPTCRCVIL